MSLWIVAWVTVAEAVNVVSCDDIVVRYRKTRQIMATLYRTYFAEGVHLARSRRLPDVRDEPVGTFLGRVPPDAPVESFGDVTHLRWQGTGTYRGNPDRQREGSFGDHDL